MRKRNKVNKLNRTASHRKAMMRNMATSLFEHERLVTTRARSKVLKTYAEKLITRAKKNLADDISKEASLHNKRQILRHVMDREIAIKLFEDIAPRFKERNGGYIRIVHLPERNSDSAKMSVIELVDRKEKVRAVKETAAAPAPTKKPKKSDDSKDTTSRDSKKKKDDKGGDGEKKKRKWWSGFKKNKAEEH